MTRAKIFYDSMCSKIESAWRVENGKLTYTAIVPAKATGTLYLPTISENSVKENGKLISNKNGIKFLRYENGKAIYELLSGNYAFTTAFKPQISVKILIGQFNRFDHYKTMQKYSKRLINSSDFWS